MKFIKHLQISLNGFVHVRVCREARLLVIVSRHHKELSSPQLPVQNAAAITKKMLPDAVRPGDRQTHKQSTNKNYSVSKSTAPFHFWNTLSVVAGELSGSFPLQINSIYFVENLWNRRVSCTNDCFAFGNDSLFFHETLESTKYGVSFQLEVNCQIKTSNQVLCSIEINPHIIQQTCILWLQSFSLFRSYSLI